MVWWKEGYCKGLWIWYKRNLDPKTASEYAYLLAPIKNANEYNAGKAKAEEVGVKALDDKTLEITLAGPCAYFLKITYFKLMMPQRQDIVEKYGEKIWYRSF